MGTITWLNKYQINIPDELTVLLNWDVYDYWERERTLDLHANLNPNSTYLDVGVEHGWMTVPVAERIGPDRCMLMEPSRLIWPNIRAIWEANHLPAPGYSIPCFAGSATSTSLLPYVDLGWTHATNGPLVNSMSYHYLHEESHRIATPTWGLDDLFDGSTVYPSVISIDVEGAECEVIHGMVNLLTARRPLVYLSIHPDLMEDNYEATPDDIRRVIADVGGYSFTCLATDHEQHWKLEPN